MKIGHRIRENRRARGLTQEDVAAALGVSAPAVSKWEGDLTFPDITLLPQLARLLGTDLNHLLGFQEEPSREEVGAYLNRLAEMKVEEAFALAREWVGEYPNSGLLALNTAAVLEGLLALQGRESQEKRAWIASLYWRAADSQEETVAQQAKVMLFSRCLKEGDYDQAEGLLAGLPGRLPYQREQLEADLALARGDWHQAGERLEGQLLWQVAQLQTTLLALMDLAAKEGHPERIAPLADRAADLGEAFLQEDYATWSLRIHQACLTQDKALGLAAVKGLLGALDHLAWPRVALYPHLPKKEPEGLPERLRAGVLRELRDPEGEFGFLQGEELEGLLC